MGKKKKTLGYLVKRFHMSQDADLKGFPTADIVDKDSSLRTSETY